MLWHHTTVYIFHVLVHSSTLLQFLFQLLQDSVKTQQQILHGKGFLVIGSLLEKANKTHMTGE